MILRRVAEHAKAQNWFAVALDFLIVVVGVFIGIEVANWNQARQERNEERRYYGQLIVDLRADVDTLSFAVKKAREFDEAAELTLAGLSGEAEHKPSPGRMATAIHHAGFIYIPQAARGTYDELISTGNLGLLRNSRLKTEIARYYGLFDELRQWDALLRAQQSDYWTETAGVLPRPVLRAAIRGVEPSLSVQEDREIWMAARSHPRLPNMLIGMAAHQERVRRDSERISGRATKLISEIERHLDESS
jgi:hypothetical protein